MADVFMLEYALYCIQRNREEQDARYLRWRLAFYAHRAEGK